jgi:SAM-dependent MidA family methyltransferase
LMFCFYLTAHVCTTLVEQLGVKVGWSWQGAALQGEVLLQLGLAQEISLLSEPGPMPLAERLSRREQLLRLVDPHLLGGFWWLLLESGGSTSPPRPSSPPAWWPA